jgi:hypothetical protein
MTDPEREEDDGISARFRHLLHVRRWWICLQIYWWYVRVGDVVRRWHSTGFRFNVFNVFSVLESGEEVSGHRARVTLDLSSDEALVLFDWLGRTSDAGEPVPFADQAEQRVLWDMECMLESVLVEPFLGEYGYLLESARSAVRD